MMTRSALPARLISRAADQRRSWNILPRSPARNCRRSYVRVFNRRRKVRPTRTPSDRRTGLWHERRGAVGTSDNGEGWPAQTVCSRQPQGPLWPTYARAQAHQEWQTMSGWRDVQREPLHAGRQGISSPLGFRPIVRKVPKERWQAGAIFCDDRSVSVGRDADRPRSRFPDPRALRAHAEAQCNLTMYLFVATPRNQRASALPRQRGAIAPGRIDGAF